MIVKFDFWHIRPLARLTFGTNTVAMHTELNPIVLHLWTQWHCLELSVNIHIIPIVNYTGELLALSLLLIFLLGYIGVFKTNLAFTGFSTQGQKKGGNTLVSR